MKTSRRLGVALCCAAGLLFGRGEQAWAEFDMLVSQNAAGTKLVTGGFDDSNSSAEDAMRVFIVDTAQDTPPSDPFFQPGDPGFRAFDQDTLTNTLNVPSHFQLPAGGTLSFDFLPIAIGASSSYLYHWDGVGSSVSFTPTSANYSMGFGPEGPTTPSPTASIVGGVAVGTSSPGFDIGTTVAAQEVLHQHFQTTLDDTSAGDPAGGIYLISTRMSFTGLTSADPTFYLIPAITAGNAGSIVASTALAEAWVTDNLLTVPEPTSFALAGMALTGLAAFARRQRLVRS